MEMEKTEAQSNYKWIALLLLWVAFFLQQGTRQIFSATLPSIRESFGVTPTEIGVVGTVFTLMYGICVPFAGIAADLLKRKWMVTVGVLVFCTGIFTSGFVSSIGLLLCTYGILNGLGQTFYYPSATSLVGQLHKDTRATALSLLQLGLYLGIIGCTWASGWMSELGANGWRTPYKLFGGIGILWAIVLVFCLKDTKPVVVEGAPQKATFKEAVMAMLSKPSAILLAIGLGMMIYVDVGFKIWMPDYLKTTALFNDDFAAISRKMPWIKGAPALFAVLWHYLGAIVGVMIGSRVADKLVKIRPGIRMEVNIFGLLVAIPFIVLMAKAQTLLTCCIGMGLFGLFRGIYDSNLFAALFDVIKPRYHASAVGIMLCCAFVFGSTSSTVLGMMKQHFSMQTGLMSLAGFYLVGVVVIAVARLFFLKRDYEG